MTQREIEQAETHTANLKGEDGAIARCELTDMRSALRRGAISTARSCYSRIMAL